MMEFMDAIIIIGLVFIYLYVIYTIFKDVIDVLFIPDDDDDYED